MTNVLGQGNEVIEWAENVAKSDPGDEPGLQQHRFFTWQLASYVT